MKNFLFLIIAILLKISLFAQDELLYNANSNFEEGNYSAALRYFLKLCKKKQYKDNPEINYKIGVCYLYTNSNKALSLNYLLLADSLKKNYFPDIEFYLALAYFHNHNFSKAEKLLKSYIKNNQNKLKHETLKEIDLLFEHINTAKELVKKPLNIKFENLGKNINSVMDDFNCFITEDETFMAFSSNRKYLSEFQEYIQKVYFSVKSYSGWEPAKPASSGINTDENEEVVGISKDGNILLVHVNRISNPDDIFYSEKTKTGNFTKLNDFGKVINSKYRECGATLTISNDTLIFASDRPGGYGGYDLYISYRLPNGSWTNPKNLGPSINTQYDENYPYITADGKTLYFSSNNPNSMGGYDIFISKKINDTLWSQPENIGYPINDTYDNYIITITSNRRYAYVSRYDTNSIGGLDIYRIIFLDVPPTPIAYTGLIIVGDSLLGTPIKDYDTTATFYLHNLEKKEKTLINITKKSKYTIALTPGTWKIEIIGEKIKPFYTEIFIKDEQPKQTVFFKNIYLIPKK